MNQTEAKLINSSNQIYYELALIINKRLYDKNKIEYRIYNQAEEIILKKINEEKHKLRQ